jgi:demethylmenaquinone methyltransferase/2-methoxy-6-polyprenyl-1,4-benzoquinol methylase
VAKARPATNVEYRLGDATKLEGVPSGAFDAATIAYGARNIPDLDALFSEMARTLRPGGVAVCLEIARPEGRVFSAFYALWFDRVVPRLGARISGDAWAYSYLPESVKEFVAPDVLSRGRYHHPPPRKEASWRGPVASLTRCPTGPSR